MSFQFTGPAHSRGTYISIYIPHPSISNHLFNLILQRHFQTFQPVLKQGTYLFFCRDKGKIVWISELVLPIAIKRKKSTLHGENILSK